jgi:lysophospholipase L1-like esterase
MLRQRWVRSINDAYMIMNQKVVDRFGYIDEGSSAKDFTETTGAMHPNAEGHASLADAMLIDLRKAVAAAFEGDQ